ncbi:MAG: response regulator [Clostridia bacterium]|nr:response regulator [Clostridia bacterium]
MKKDRIKTFETDVYGFLLISNIIGLALEFLCCLTVMNQEQIPVINYITNRLYLIYFVTFITVFTIYVYYVSFKDNKAKSNRFLEKGSRARVVATIAYIIGIMAVTLLPLYYYYDTNAVYSYGPATEALYLICFIYLIVDLYCLIRNYKNIKSKKNIPLFVLFICLVIAFTIRTINPGIILITSSFALVTAIMYFTIENPDTKMISELYKNRKLIEKSNEDTSKFIFRMTQDIKKPVKDIISISHSMTSMDDREALLSAGKYINNYANQIDYLMNKALNISNMDTQKIKVFDTRYNVENLFKEITFRAKEDIKENIKFDFNISSNIPTYLYGDTIKLKQVISSVINIANDFTTEGFISLDVSSIIRYNMCRLIITIEDSGKGIGIDRINQILSFNSDDLKNIDTDNKDDRKLDILSVKKLINMLGGSLMIKSEPNVGTTVTIILEQKVVETKETEISKKLENYEQSLYGEKQVLVVDDDEKELEKIEKQISSDGIMVSSTVYGRDAIEKIRSKLKYDLIILDDDLGQSSALTVLQELQKIKNFKTPVVVMINDNKEKIKLHYLQDGFADTISKSKLETEIDRIMKRF